jgi:hypothetical protein
MQLAHYLGLLHRAEQELARAFGEVATAHEAEVDVDATCHTLAQKCDGHASSLEPFVKRYGEESEDEPERLHRTLFEGTRSGPLGLLRDLHDLYLMASECEILWSVIRQAAQGLRDHELLDVVGKCAQDTEIEIKWLRTRIQTAAPQSLLVAQ